MELAEPPMPECKAHRYGVWSYMREYMGCFRCGWGAQHREGHVATWVLCNPRAMRCLAVLNLIVHPLSRAGPHPNPCREKYDRLLALPRHLPIRVLFPMTGFWRDFMGGAIPPEGGQWSDGT